MSGVATGIQLKYASGLDAEQQTIVVKAVAAQSDDPITIAIGVVGTIGWLAGVLAAATALHRAGAPRLSVFLLVPAALIFFGCFFLAAAQLELVHWQPALETKSKKVTD